MFEFESLVLMLLSVDVEDVDAHHGVEFDGWSLFYWLSNRHNNSVYKVTTMPPAAKESHPPPGVPNEPEDAEAEESDDYDIGVGGDPVLVCWFPSEQCTSKDDDDDEYAGEDDEEEGEPNGVSMSP